MKRWFFALLAFGGALPATAQDAKTLSRAATLLKKIPSRATIAQVRRVLPKGTKFSPQRTTSVGGWNFITQPFHGSVTGQFVFANNRKVPQRKPGMPPLPPMSAAHVVMPKDGVHYVEIFLASPTKNAKAGALTARTKRYIDTLSTLLGKPASRENTGEEGGPDAEGWIAKWKLSGGREMHFAESFPLLADGPRPLLTLTFSYSKIYRP
jgi:hypothetical protein